MRLVLRLCTTLAAGVLLAVPMTGLQAAAPDEAALSRLSMEWMSAIEQKNRAALERIVARDFLLQTPGNERSQAVPRDEWIANAIDQDWSDFRYENLAVSVDGDRATVTSRLHFRVAPFPFALDAGIVDVWEKRDGRWQVTNRYLGESQVQQRMALVGGILGTIFAGLVVNGLARLIRRRRRRRAAERI